MSIDQFLLSADTTDLNYPEVRPTLDLNFARTKTLDPRITFTRASGGSYVGADGLIKYAGVNEARFDHNPETGESLGLLIEESRINLINYSEDLSSQFYNVPGISTILNFDISPDGKQSATRLVENNIFSAKYLAKNIGTMNSGVTYTISCFVKAIGSNRFFSLIFETSSLFGGNYPRAGFNINNGTIVSGSVVLGSASIENYGNGWYRCFLTATPSVTGSATVQFRLQNSNTSASLLGFYQGDGVSGILCWGTQAEQGSFPTSYIPTQGSTRTRAADNASMVGENFSSWYNQSEGTFYVSSRVDRVVTPGRRLFEASDGTGQNRLEVGYYQSGTYIFSTYLNSRQYQTYPAINSFPFITKQITSYGSSQLNYLSTADNIVNTFNRFQKPNYTILTIGRSTGAEQFNGTISQLTYYPRRLTNTQLQTLTK